MDELSSNVNVTDSRSGRDKEMKNAGKNHQAFLVHTWFSHNIYQQHTPLILSGCVCVCVCVWGGGGGGKINIILLIFDIYYPCICITLVYVFVCNTRILGNMFKEGYT